MQVKEILREKVQVAVMGRWWRWWCRRNGYSDAAYTAQGADGGAGAQTAITGTSTAYAGGGGGGLWNASNDSNGGAGGGGHGGGNGSNPSLVAGVVNRGGGGGGSGSTTSGAGGSGIVVLRYESQQVSPGQTSNVFTGSSGGDTIITDNELMLFTHSQVLVHLQLALIWKLIIS